MIELLPLEFVVTSDQLTTAMCGTFKIQQWHYFTGEISGKNIRLKYFRLYAQIIDINGVRHGGTDFRNQREFIAFIQEVLK